KLVHSEVPELLDVKPSVDPKLAEIVRRALKKRPVDRYASAAEMREALLQYLHEVPNPLTKADIARMMGAVFVEQRAAVRAEIEKQLVKAEQGPLEIGNLAESVKVLGYDSSIPSFLPGTLADAGHRRTASAVTAPNARSIAPTASVSPSVSPSAPPRHGRSALRAVALLLAFAAAAAGGAAAVLRFVPHPLSSGPLKASADTMPSSWAPVLETMPTGAEVSWNGTVLGHTPYTLRLPPGPHTIVVSKDGYLSEPVVLGIDASSPFNIVLKPIKTAPSVEPVERSAPPPVAPRFFPRREVTPEIARAPVAEATEAEPEIEVTDRAVEAPAPASPPVERAPAPIEPSPRAPGTMDATAVAATIRAHGDEIQACFDRALMDRTDLHGRLTVQAVVGPTGHVLSASATNTIEGGGRLRVCVLSAVESWTFPAPAGGVNGAVTRTFVFEGH
ncbi:MAG TPA: AgmX/PglI C-terminal domain-containing protein, partial [Polyangiaceae bacterium]